MDRSEVESLAEIVRLAAEKLFPGIQVYIMGSYRRGKESCGDVDVHLTHPTDPNFAEKIPNDALGRIIGEFFFISVQIIRTDYFGCW
jgi:DNA polymerase/3'-5' exonuclease PolX